MTSQEWRAAAKPGSIVGFSGKDLAANIINVMTGGWPHWGLSHVGILSYHDEYGLLLYESTTFNKTPCVIQKKLFSGAQAQYPSNKVFDYDGRVWLYPPRVPLRPWETKNLQTYLNSTVGTPYDMIGAIRSGGNLFNWLESKLHKENKARIFCSEWCAAAWDSFERFDTDKMSRWNPNRYIREMNHRALLLKPVRVK